MRICFLESSYSTMHRVLSSSSLQAASRIARRQARTVLASQNPLEFHQSPRSWERNHRQHHISVIAGAAAPPILLSKYFFSTEVALPEEKEKKTRSSYRRKRKRRPPTKRVTLELVRHEPQDFARLFDSILPVTNSRIEDILRLVTQASDAATLYDVLNATNTNNQTQIAVLEFLLSTTRKASKKAATATATVEEEEKDDARADVETLMAARRRALQTDLQWSRKAKRQQQGEQTTTPAGDDETQQAMLESKATALVTHLKTTIPSKLYHATIKFLDSYAQDKYSMRYLQTHLRKQTGSYFHFVAMEMSDFMLDFVPSKDSEIAYSKKQWSKFRQKFVKTLVSVQDEMIKGVDQTDGVTEEEATVSKVEEDLNLDAPTTTRQNQDKRFRRPMHLLFDASALHEGPREETVLSDTIAFLDNLPIDIDKDLLTELYGRCGDIESIQIFNQRPDLDPGPLSKAQSAARRKKQLRSASTRKWQRPRSPVYAMIEFTTPEACAMCVDDSLRIFGMLIQRHPVRSMRASDMHRLFIENLEEGTMCADLEFQLRRQLQPDLFVSLEAAQNNRAVVGSCEIRFPSFESAWNSYPKLLPLGLVNWMQTPKDAESWWKRKRGFD